MKADNKEMPEMPRFGMQLDVNKTYTTGILRARAMGEL